MKTWVISEVITGARIAIGLSKSEAIGAAVIKLTANGRDVLVKAINKFTEQFGWTEVGKTMNIPGHA